MPTYLLTWNPNNYDWHDLEKSIKRVQSKGRVQDSWSTGNSRRIHNGDRLFLIKLGEDPRGIMGSGRAVGDVIQKPHWDGSDRDANYVSVEWDTLLPPDQVLPKDALSSPALKRVHWSSQSSGIQIPDDAAEELEALWASFTRRAANDPDETATTAERGQDWSRQEVQATIADYFTMLRAELLARPYNKTEHRNALITQLDNRSGQSIEFKHCNISAVLAQDGLPYINGYKPRGNFQRLLIDETDHFLDEHPGFFEGLADSPILNPIISPSPALQPAAVFDAPPQEMIVPGPTSEPWISRRGRKIDFVERDAQNRRLGRLGEEFAVELERQRLNEAGRDDLAAKIDHVADTCGDGLGFDVLSFNEQDDSERLLEVKTTGLGKYFPFYVSACELRCSEAMHRQYHLYRVFDFATQPRVYVLQGPLSKVCRLDPVAYRAVI